MAEMLSGGDMLIRALQDEGVEYIFGYPGGSALHIYDAIFRQQKIEHILVRHEQAATHMADGYARSTGDPGVVLVTSGPGATNAITGIATAYMDSIPMVVISGQVPSDLIGTDAFQETDMVGISRPVVKHSFMVRDASEIPSVVKKAFHIATTGRPGPVVIDVPKDTTDPSATYAYEYPSSVAMRSYQPAFEGDSHQINLAIEALLAAKRPVFYVGGGVIQADAEASLRALVKAANVPVTSTLMGLGAYPGSDTQSLGMLGMHGTYEANMAMHETDLIFALGARFDDRVTNNPDKFSPKATIVHLDVDSASVDKIVRSDIALVGDAGWALNALWDAYQARDAEREASAKEKHGGESRPTNERDFHLRLRESTWAQDMPLFAQTIRQIRLCMRHRLRAGQKIFFADALGCGDRKNSRPDGATPRKRKLCLCRLRAGPKIALAHAAA